MAILTGGFLPKFGKKKRKNRQSRRRKEKRGFFFCPGFGINQKRNNRTAENGEQENTSCFATNPGWGRHSGYPGGFPPGRKGHPVEKEKKRGATDPSPGVWKKLGRGEEITPTFKRGRRP